jgi:hypothetical protein
MYGYADYRPAFAPLTVCGVLFGLGFKFNWEKRYNRMSLFSYPLLVMDTSLTSLGWFHSISKERKRLYCPEAVGMGRAYYLHQFYRSSQADRW